MEIPEGTIYVDALTTKPIVRLQDYLHSDGMLLKTVEREGVGYWVPAAKCGDCIGQTREAVCNALPECAYSNAGGKWQRVRFVPVLEHEPTAERYALLKLKGEV